MHETLDRRPLRTPTVVHFGSNSGKKPVVILLSSLLVDGAPLATPVTNPPA
jgi:hypothetical protein